MASIVKTKIGYSIQLSPNEDIKRPKISLGKIKEKDAHTLLRHVENLIQARNGLRMPDDTRKWSQGINPGLRKRLESLGLLEPKARDRWTVAAWVTHFIETSTKPGTDNRRKISNVGERLQLFFKDDLLVNVTTFQCLRFRDYLKDVVKLSENTTRKHTAISRQIFKGAVDAGLLSKNPFQSKNLPVTVRANESKFFYVTPELAQRVLDAMPTIEWKLIFALCRYGGLRCPSEVVALKWTTLGTISGQFRCSRN